MNYTIRWKDCDKSDAVTKYFEEKSKKFEEFLRGTIDEALEWVETNEIRGEFVVVVEGNLHAEEEALEEVYWVAMSIVEHVDYIIEETQIHSKEAIKEVAKLRGLSKRDVYNEYHQ